MIQKEELDYLIFIKHLDTFNIQHYVEAFKLHEDELKYLLQHYKDIIFYSESYSRYCHSCGREEKYDEKAAITITYLQSQALKYHSKQQVAPVTFRVYEEGNKLHQDIIHHTDDCISCRNMKLVNE
jgi:hypothetical protein